MSDIHLKELKKIYINSKKKLRQWENEFFAENGRLPSKLDIRASPVNEHYKLYWKIKTQILEAEILGENNLSKQIPLSNKPKSDVVLKEHSNALENEKSKNERDSYSTDTTDTTNANSRSAETGKADEREWSDQLIRTTPAHAVEKEKCTLLNETIAGRLFKDSSFKKRNPRKSLPFSKKKSNKSISSEEIISVDSLDISSIMSPFSDCQSDAIDQSLNGSAFSVEHDCSPNIKALITSSSSLSPLLNKPVQSRVEAEQNDVQRIPTQTISMVQIMTSDSSVATKPNKVNTGWVDRCAEVCQESKTERKSSDSGFESMEFSHAEESKVEELSDDDLIGNSDNELETNRRSSSFVSQKRKAEWSPNQKPTSQRIECVAENIPPNANRTCKKLKMDIPAEAPRGKKNKEYIKKGDFEKKLSSGVQNENYVRINLKKKVFVRGKRNFSFSGYKKRQWKMKKKSLDEEKESGGVVQCYKCEEAGHFSRNCKKASEDKLLEDEDYESDELPTIKEVEKLAKEVSDKNVLTDKKPPVEDTSLSKVNSIYNLQEDGTLIETPAEVYEALRMFGHTKFRPGQEEAIMRILSGQSTLLIIATGGGKSLCYQLPAYLYAIKRKCITLVVSPLVSLMEDQVTGSSTFFKVGCLHNSQTQKQRETVIEDAKRGKLYALLVSPEAVVSGDFSAFGSIFRQLPPISFACIDEVHCLSQWSHNFRPSYLMISKVLRNKFGITTILGLTATATVSTINSIARELGITAGSGVIKDISLPDNLCLSVSREENKSEALIQLLHSPRFKDANAILIYCTRRDECERLAVYIRTRLQDPAIKCGKSVKGLFWSAESYHAGLAAARRKQVQKAFMRGNLRIVVATVAFGMGINKRDIRGVIHYNMPKDFESYVQEVGRAGRDGMVAYCHLFLDSEGRDLYELRRHIHSDSVDRHVLRKLLQRVFKQCECGEEFCRGHEIGFDCSDTIQALDIPEENIYTLLCYLELHEKKFIKVLPPVYMNCKVKSYKGIKEIISVAKKCPPLAYACALKSNHEKLGILEFNVMEIADKLGWDSAVVKSELKNAEWRTTGDGKRRRTGIGVEFSGLGFRVFSRGNMTLSELDETLEYLVQRVDNQEKQSIAKLDFTFRSFDNFAQDSYDQCLEDKCASGDLKHAIRKYFEAEEWSSKIPLMQLKVETFDEDAVISDIRTLICTYRDNAFNGRAVARIFHGIQSPNYPASLWYKCKFWRKHIDKDFNQIIRLATTEILRFKV